MIIMVLVMVTIFSSSAVTISRSIYIYYTLIYYKQVDIIVIHYGNKAAIQSYTKTRNGSLRLRKQMKDNEKRNKNNNKNTTSLTQSQFYSMISILCSHHSKSSYH